MSYDNPDDIPESQINNAQIWHNTAEVVRILDLELRTLGLRLEMYRYAKNEYCGDSERSHGCTCPHWFQVSIEALVSRLYEPHCYVWICKRKHVYEIRYHEMVDEEFWINTETNRTQGKGYVHSYGLAQAAQDIRIIHQAAEIHDYKSAKFTDYFAPMFKKRAKGHGGTEAER
jgi:hypothetical protein